jgi:predicted nucleotidyltransferase
MLTEGDIRRIAERVVKGYAPLVLGTFGSYALGTAHAKSDLDVFAIKLTPLPPIARRRVVGRLLFDVLHPLDVHVFTPEEFEGRVASEQSFEWVIAQQARLYAWSPEAQRLTPSLLPRLATLPSGRTATKT